MRLNYPTNIKIVKVPCTGRVDIILILRAFESGVDGVYLAGCLEGECHFLKGNLRAKKRVLYVKELLDEVGLGGARVEMYNMSSAQGQRFAEVAREMTDKIRALGPSPLRDRGQESRDQVK
jgi:F420-non-reducing hydrogenase iron-sulfur subunit